MNNEELENSLSKLDLSGKDRSIMIGFLQVGLLEKFLNDPKRLGMTEAEQIEKIKAIEAIT